MTTDRRAAWLVPLAEARGAGILSPIWHVKAATAREVRQRIRAVLEWAIAMDLRNDNPCDRVVPVLGPQNDTVTHRQALPHKDVAAAIETVRGGAAQRSRPSGWRSSFWCSRRPSPNNEPLRDTSNEPLALDGVLTLAKLQVAGEVPEAATTGDRIRSAERAKVKRSEAEANGCDRTEAATR